MNDDVLILRVPLRHGMGYPTANSSGDGFRGGKKSPSYKALAFDVEEAARAAIEAGWPPIEYPCRIIVTYYRPDRHVVDALNLGSCEANALTRAGVWTDDELAREPILSYQPGSPGEPRVVIMVQRLAPPIGAEPRKPRPRRDAPIEEQQIVPPLHGRRMPLLDGRPIPWSDVPRLLHGDSGSKGRT